MPFFLSHSMLNLIDTAFSLQYIHPAVYNRWTGFTGLDSLDSTHWTGLLDLKFGDHPRVIGLTLYACANAYAKRSHVFGSL